MNAASLKIDEYLANLPAWQKNNLSSFRALISREIPDIEEDWKWNVPVFMFQGKPLFAMSAFKAHTKFNFIQNGALLEDTDKLFNNGMESKKSRGIDIREGESINEDQLTRLIKSAVRRAIT